jgi:hypothetical protein
MSHFTVLVVGDDVDGQLANKKWGMWDWYTFGGRWTGYFKVRENPKYPNDVFLGKPGVMSEPAKPGWVDSLRKCDIDIEAMQQYEQEKAEKEYDEVLTLTAGCPKPRDFEEISKEYKNVEEARKVYWKQPFVKKARDYLLHNSPSYYLVDRSEFVARAVRRAIVTFAILMEGKWYQRGEMRTFGVVSDAVDDDEWCKKFFALLGALPDDTRLTVVDCHI